MIAFGKGKKAEIEIREVFYPNIEDFFAIDSENIEGLLEVATDRLFSKCKDLVSDEEVATFNIHYKKLPAALKDLNKLIFAWANKYVQFGGWIAGTEVIETVKFEKGKFIE